MANGGMRDYVSLWSVEDHTPTFIKTQATKEAEMWHGFPSNPIAPVPIPVQTGKYIRKVRPTPPLGGRKTTRGGGYSSLSNYNNIP